VIATPDVIYHAVLYKVMRLACIILKQYPVSVGWSLILLVLKSINIHGAISMTFLGLCDFRLVLVFSDSYI
jgi:hypothetical protein